LRDSRGAVVPVVFHFPGSLAPGAQRVAVAGPFNGWNAQSHRLTKTPEGNGRSPYSCPPGAWCTVSTWMVRHGSTPATTAGYRIAGGPSIRFAMSGRSPGYLRCDINEEGLGLRSLFLHNDNLRHGPAALTNCISRLSARSHSLRKQATGAWCKTHRQMQGCSRAGWLSSCEGPGPVVTTCASYNRPRSHSR